jgi:hypothetical protein
MKKAVSREFQCELKVAQFPNGEKSLAPFCVLVKSLHRQVVFDDHRPELVRFEQLLFDTPEHDFADAQFKLRQRVSTLYCSYTHKATGRDLFYVQDLDVGSSDDDAVSKLEENIYSFHVMWAHQTAVKLKSRASINTVADWCRLFPGAAAVAAKTKPLVRGPSTFVSSYSGLTLDFHHTRCDATIEFKYADSAQTKLLAVEFAWKHQPDRDSGFDPATVRLMRRFFVAINTSGWVELDNQLERSKADQF